MFEALDVHPREQQPHGAAHEPLDRRHDAAVPQQRLERRIRDRRQVAQQSVPRRIHVGRAAGAGGRAHRFHEVPHRGDLVRGRFADRESKALLEFGEQLYSLHAVEPEIELEIGVGPHDHVWLGAAAHQVERRAYVRVVLPFLFGCARWPLGLHLLGCLAVEQTPLDLVAPQLAGGGARQRVEPHVVAEHSLVRRQPRTQALHLETQQVAGAGNAALLERVGIGHDDRVQPLGRGLIGPCDAHHAQLLDD